jgi:hypothetical protein
MLSFTDMDPQHALFLLLGAVGVVLLSVLLWVQLQHRSRRYGGGNLAAALMAAAIVGLLVAISPNFLPFDVGIFILILSLMVIYRPDQVIKYTGGPSLRYRALGEGRELQILVREHGGWSVAGRNEEVAERIAGLAAFEGPGTERYVGLLRETLLADPEAPGVADKLAQLAEADAELRAALKARPMFERDLAKRAAALDEAPAAD